MQQKHFSKFRSNRPFFKILSVFSLAGFALVAAFGAFFFTSQTNKDEAKAADPILNISSGQTIRLTVYYDNASTTQDYNGLGQIRFLIDERLDYIPGSLKDVYNNQVFCINDNPTAGIRTVQNISGQTTVINYSPRSSQTAGNDSSCTTGGGSVGNVGNITIPKAPAGFSPSNQNTWRGKLQFQVKLKDNALVAPYNLKIGDIIEPNLAAGKVALQGEFSLNQVVFGSPKYAVRISGVIVNQQNIVTGECLYQPVLIGEKAVCGFQLTGGNNTTDPYILPADFKAQITGSAEFADKNSCQIDNGLNLLKCNIPTIGADGKDNQPVNLTLNDTTQARTQINLYTNFDPKGDFDKDSITDEVECGFSSGQNCSDTDKDGIPDYKDSDSDNDGIPDMLEAKCSGEIGKGFPCDTDGDKIPDFRDADADEDGKLDKDEKGGLTCKMELYPAICDGQLRDSDSDGIPNFRDKQDADTTNVRYLIPLGNVKFNKNSSFIPVWKTDDLTLEATINQKITSCEIKLRKYSSVDWWVDSETKIDGNTCKGTLKTDKQYAQKWDSLIILTDEKGEKWGAYPSYSMKDGSLAITAIESSIVESPKI
jgi:hypothetical protein